ncbi:hypothetical protein CR513_03028, partial [Mucuna pruriens]
MQSAMPAKCRDPGIFSVPCTIDDCTFADAMLDLGALINFMPSSMYKSLNFGDLEPMGIIIQLAYRSIAHSLADFYVLDMEDEPSGKGSILILNRLFLMTTLTKIDVHAGIISMEFGDNKVQFNIFEVMKHSVKDHSLFGIDIIEELVEDYILVEISNSVETTHVLDTSDSMTDGFDSVNMIDMLDFSNSVDDFSDLANMIDLSPLYLGPRDPIGTTVLSLGIWSQPLWIPSNSPESIDCGFYWHTIFQDAHHFVTSYEQCQRIRVATIEDMRCPSNPFFSTKSLMSGVLTSWSISYLLRFGVPKALINDQGSHFCNRTMSTLLEKYGVVHRERLELIIRRRSLGSQDSIPNPVRNVSLSDSLEQFISPLG